MATLKKTILYLGAPVLAVLISIPFWPEQYGDGYNEQQRKIWNEQMALTKGGQDNFMRIYPFSCNDPDIEQQIEKRGHLAARLRDSSAPDWNVTPPVSPDLSKLPPEGMTFDELLHEAESNKNPDAYLSLISTFWIISESPLKSCFQRVKEYATKAHELKRPGSDFLMRAIDLREDTLNSKNKDDARYHLEKAPGYKEFKDMIEAGDFTLFKALITIWPGMHGTTMSANLEEALENKARQGNITAQRQLGEFGFIGFNNTLRIIEREQNAPRSPWILWLSKKVKKWCPNLITIRETMDVFSPTRDKLNEYSAWLKKAADAGDLVAMQLWLRYGVETLQEFSKEDWDDILLYSDTLLKAGYEQSFPLWWVKFEQFVYGHARTLYVLNRSYSTESLERLKTACESSLLNRGSKNATVRRLWSDQFEEQTSKDNLDLLNKVRRQEPLALIFDCWNYSGFSPIRQIKDQAVKQHYVGIIREIAQEKDPLFMLMLADLIKKKIAEPSSPGEATRLLENTWPLCPKYNVAVTLSDDSGLCYLSELVVDRLMVIYLLEDPTPENLGKAFELAQQYLSLNELNSQHNDWKDHIHNFYLSLIYQKGYGTPKNRDSEIYYYKKLLESMKSMHSYKEKKIKNLMEQFDYKIPE